VPKNCQWQKAWKMAVDSLEVVELDEQRAELKAVLESRDFVRAPTLTHLLSYLCERLFAGETNQIKEYSIGVEVFHRGASFDQDSDSIVRVQANRLRKRLADYYAGEGATHRLQIRVPVGAYVPRFIAGTGQGSNQAPGLGAQSVAGSTGAGVTLVKRLAGWVRRVPGQAWMLAAAVLVLLGLGFAWRVSRQEKHPTPAPGSSEPAALFADAQFGPPAGPEIRILCGANRSFVDHAGKLWNADVRFSGGTVVKSAVLHIWRTQDQGFYRSSRQGQFRYDIPLSKGIHELRLHFSETVYGPESTGTGGEGSRIMTVRANGKTLLAGFDVVADAGASRTADVKVFPEISPAADGMLHLEFSADNGVPAILSAIEILPGVRGHMLPVRILPRQTPYYSNDSRWWSPDNYFEGGRLAAYSTPVNGTDDPEFYETERWGNFTYAIPVSSGRYAVTLYFAARHPDRDQPQPPTDDSRPAGASIFNVFCNGNSLLRNFDLTREAREKDVVIRRFEGLQPNAQGKLLLSFVPVEGYATVSGIEVLPK